MRKMKRVLAAAMAACMVFSMAACGGKDEGKKESKNVTLVYAEVNPLDTIVGQTGQYFADKVKELSGGTVTIDIQASGVLGAENDVLDNILGGGDTIDMARISAFALTSYGAKKSMLLSLPFTFESRAHFWNFANSDLAPEFLNEPQTLGLPIRGIFYGEEGFRHFFTKNAISSVADLAGMKLRVSNDPIMNGRTAGRCCSGVSRSRTTSPCISRSLSKRRILPAKRCPSFLPKTMLPA